MGKTMSSDSVTSTDRYWEEEITNYYRNMSAREREYWTPLLLARDGYSCSSCKKPIAVLVEIRKKLFPYRKFKLPVIVIDHVDGDSRFTDSREGIKGGNLRHLCYSCNRKAKKEKIPIIPTLERRPEHKKSDISKPVFRNWLNRYLAEYGQICYKFMINRGAKISNDSSPITVQRWYEVDFGVKGGYDEFDIGNYAIKCPYGKCDGTHVCFYGEKPRTLDEFKELVKIDHDSIEKSPTMD